MRELSKKLVCSFEDIWPLVITFAVDDSMHFLLFQEYVPEITCPTNWSSSRFPDKLLFDLYFICHKKRCQSSVALHQVKKHERHVKHGKTNLHSELIGFF